MKLKVLRRNLLKLSFKVVMSFYAYASRNKRNTYLLMIVFLLLISFIGWFLGYLWSNSLVGLFISVSLVLFYYFLIFSKGDELVLSLAHARQVTKREYPFLFNTIEGLSIAAGIKPPKAFVIDSSALNAFATGLTPDKGCLVFTTALLEKLSREELEGVVGHEISHLVNQDSKFMMITALLVGVLVMLSYIGLRASFFRRGSEDNKNGLIVLLGFLSMLLAPLLAQLLKFAVSREREFLADASSVKLTRNPHGLISALKTISDSPPMRVNPSISHLFINNPFSHDKVSKLFSTHPPISERIKRLEKM